MSLYVGIDWGKTSSVYAFGVGGNEPMAVRKVSNSAKGLTTICDTLVSTANGEPVVVVIEAGAPAVESWLVSTGFTVHVVDGKQARRFVESLNSSGSKSDKLDAIFAWHLAQSPRHLSLPVTEVSADDRAIDLAVRARDQLSKSTVRLVNQLRALLSQLVPDVESQLSSLTTKYARGLIRLVPTPWHAQQVTDEVWSQFQSDHRIPIKKRSPLRAAIAGDARRPQFSETAARSIAETVTNLVCQLDELLRADGAFEETIRALVEASEVATVITTIKGVGLRVSAKLRATVFSEKQLARADQSKDPRDYATRFAKCAPVEKQTGTTCSGPNAVQMRRSGSDQASLAILQAAAHVSMRLGWARAMLKHRRSKGDGYYTALRKIGRSLLRIMSAMVRSGEPYDDEFYVGQLKKRGVTWAQEL